MITTAQDILEKFVQLPADEKKKVISVILSESNDENWLVENSRVSRYSVIHAFKQGAGAEEIALRFPTLDLRQIYSVINSYLQNPNEFEDYFDEQLERQDEQKRQIENRFSPEGIRQRLLERKSK